MKDLYYINQDLIKDLVKTILIIIVLLLTNKTLNIGREYLREVIVLDNTRAHMERTMVIKEVCMNGAGSYTTKGVNCK